MGSLFIVYLTKRTENEQKRREQMAMDYEWAGDVKRGGLWLKKLRESQGLTQRDAERRTGGKISSAYISAIETAVIVKPPMAALVALGEALGVTPNEVAQAYGFWSPAPSQRQEAEELTYLRRVLERQTPGQRYSLLQSVRALASVAERQL